MWLPQAEQTKAKNMRWVFWMGMMDGPRNRGCRIQIVTGAGGLKTASFNSLPLVSRRCDINKKKKRTQNKNKMMMMNGVIFTRNIGEEVVIWSTKDCQALFISGNSPQPS
jgi:hypothetical protein